MKSKLSIIILSTALSLTGCLTPQRNITRTYITGLQEPKTIVLESDRAIDKSKLICEFSVIGNTQNYNNNMPHSPAFLNSRSSNAIVERRELRESGEVWIYEANFDERWTSRDAKIGYGWKIQTERGIVTKTINGIVFNLLWGKEPIPTLKYQDLGQGEFKVNKSP